MGERLRYKINNYGIKRDRTNPAIQVQMFGEGGLMITGGILEEVRGLDQEFMKEEVSTSISSLKDAALWTRGQMCWTGQSWVGPGEGGIQRVRWTWHGNRAGKSLNDSEEKGFLWTPDESVRTSLHVAWRDSKVSHWRTRRSAGKLLKWLRVRYEGGNDSPLQYSCLENSTDRGAWGLQSMGSQSQTWLSTTYRYEDLT